MHRRYAHLKSESGPTLTHCYTCKRDTIFHPIKYNRRIFWMCEMEMAPYAGSEDRVCLKLRGMRLKRGVWKQHVRKGALQTCEMVHDGHKCSGGLTAHHAIPREFAPALSMDIGNGVCLCESAHHRLHSDWRYEVECWRHFAHSRPEDYNFVLNSSHSELYIKRIETLIDQYDLGDFSDGLCGMKKMVEMGVVLKL